MNKQERKRYNREYRAEGFGKLGDKRYYLRNRERCNERSREYYAAHRGKLLARAIAKHKAKREGFSY